MGRWDSVEVTCRRGGNQWPGNHGDCDQHAAFEEAAQNLLKLDAEGSSIVQLIADNLVPRKDDNPSGPEG